MQVPLTLGNVAPIQGLNTWATHGSIHTPYLYIWVSMIFMSFTSRGSVAMCRRGVVDLCTLADFAASATNVRQCGPHSRLEHLSHSRIYAHASFFIYECLWYSWLSHVGEQLPCLGEVSLTSVPWQILLQVPLTLGNVAPVQGLNNCVHSRIYANAFFIYMSVYDIHEFHM